MFGRLAVNMAVCNDQVRGTHYGCRAVPPASLSKAFSYLNHAAFYKNANLRFCHPSCLKMLKHTYAVSKTQQHRVKSFKRFKVFKIKLNKL